MSLPVSDLGSFKYKVELLVHKAILYSKFSRTIYYFYRSSDILYFYQQLSIIFTFCLIFFPFLNNHVIDAKYLIEALVCISQKL